MTAGKARPWPIKVTKMTVKVRNSTRSRLGNGVPVLDGQRNGEGRRERDESPDPGKGEGERPLPWRRGIFAPDGGNPARNVRGGIQPDEAGDNDDEAGHRGRDHGASLQE